MRRKNGQKAKQLRASWNKLLKSHGLNPRNSTRRKREFRPLLRAPDPRLLGAAGTSIQEFHQRLKEAKPQIEHPIREHDEIMQARETEARKVKHTIMPLHKGPYVVVTDPDLIPMMGKKTFDGY